MSQPPPPPQVSPDGKFYLDGPRWVSMALPTTAISSVGEKSGFKVAWANLRRAKPIGLVWLAQASFLLFHFFLSLARIPEFWWDYREPRYRRFLDIYVLSWTAYGIAVIAYLYVNHSLLLPAVFSWIAAYRLLDLVIGTMWDATSPPPLGRSVLQSVLLGWLNVIQIVLLFAILDIGWSGAWGPGGHVGHTALGFVYISCVTLFTLGSDYYPMNSMAKFLTMLELGTGFTVIGVVVAALVSRMASTGPEKAEPPASLGLARSTGTSDQAR